MDDATTPVWPRVNVLADRLFRAAPQRRPADLAGTVILVGDGSGALRRAIERPDARNQVMVHATSLADVAARLARQPDHATTLVVSLDAFDCLTDAVDRLMAFRHQHPSVAVVIASAQFKRDDFSPERRAIADASIKLPASAARLRLAVTAARRHNTASSADH